MINTCAVYMITNIANDKKYIGGSVNIERRWFDHTNTLSKNCHENKFLQEDWVIYGKSNFQFQILEVCDRSNVDHLREREEFWINKLKTSNEELYNQCEFPTLKGTVGLRWNHTEEGKANIAKAQTGKIRGPYPQEWRDNISKALKGHKRSAESIQKGALSNTGKIRGPYDQEHRDKISAGNKGKLLGRKQSPESVKKRSIAMLATWARKKALLLEK